MDPRNITSDAPDNCPTCGTRWSHCESVKTDDPAGLDGWEDWRYCSTCKTELFYPQKLDKEQAR